MQGLIANRSFWGLTLTQFLGAFNDSAYRNFVTLLALFEVQRYEIGWVPTDPQALIFGIFSLPFVLFALFSGSLADRYSKRKIIVSMKILEVIVMILGALAFSIIVFAPDRAELCIVTTMVVMFLMGSHSAFFSPSKYGAIPEIVPETHLSRANATIVMTTMAATLLGLTTGAGVRTFLNERGLPFYYSGAVFIAIALAGLLFSLLIRPLPAADPERRLRFNLPRDIYQEYRFLARDRELFLAVMAISWWWLMASLALQVLNAYGKNALGYESAGTPLSYPLLLGVGAGGILAGILSGKHVELGLVPIGAAGMGLGFCSLWVLEPTPWNANIALACAGAFAGLFNIPLSAYTQERPSKEEKGRVMGIIEQSTFIFIFLSSGVYYILANLLALDSQEMLLATGILTIGGAGVIFSFTPRYTVRFFLWVLTHTIYRIRVLHPEHVPAHGGALLVANHVSYVDPFLVGASVPRFIRYLMHRAFIDVPVVGQFSRLMRVIPIADNDPPRELVARLQEATDHAAAGHIVCIFAEGGITRTGNLRPFSKGLERIARRASVPIIPVYIDRIWGSIFSFRGGQFFGKWPSRFPYPVTVAFGAPLPSDTPVYRVRRAVQELGAETLDARKRRGRTLATEFLKCACKYARRTAVIDHTRSPLGYRRLLIGTLLLRRLLRERVAKTDHVGVVLPPSAAGVLANAAIAVLGKVAVNLNYSAGARTVQAAIDECKLDTILTSPEFLAKVGLSWSGACIDLEALLDEATKWQRFRAFLTALLPRTLLARLPGVPRDPDAPVTVIFSSGSTGTPKGVCLSHHNVLSNVHSFAQVFDFHRDDRIVGILPFFHSFGYTGTLWCPLVHGITMLFHPSPIDARAIAVLIRELRGTILLSAPTFYQSYLRRFTKEDVATVRLAIAGAEKLKPVLASQWQERLGVTIYEGYGCTELSPGVALNLPDVTDAEVHQVNNKPGTIGHPLPGVAAKVVDPETFAELSVDAPGMLLIKGPNVMLGYLGRPDLTREAIRDGWYVTGDVASIDNDGFITITDRLSRFSKIGGEMVPHVTVESEILALVLELQGCSVEAEMAEDCADVAVTAVPDASKGERLVVLHSPLRFPIAELFERLHRSSLPKLWLPRRDCFFEVDSIPKLGSGKFDLRAVRQLAEERIAAEPAEGVEHAQGRDPGAG